MSAAVTSNLDGHSVNYRIEGTFDEVSEAVARVMGSYPTPGYGTWFNWPPGKVYPSGQANTYLAPIELGDGRWVARGHRSTSCD